MRSNCLSILGMVIVCAGWAGPAWAQQVIETPDLGPPRTSRTSTRSTPLPMIRREIRRFDFEERTLQPHDFPPGLYRISPATGSPGDTSVQSRPGHPLFGEMVYSDREPHAGDWSFSFDLQGGSMAVAVAPDTIPIIPGGDYLITAWVRTEGLEHSRARVVGVLYDRFGLPIPESTTYSELLKTDGVWHEVSIELLGNFSEAADLVFELQLLQPSQFGPRIVEEFRPVLEDIAGRVSFDDIAVWHMPRVHMGTGQPGNVIVAPEVPQVGFSVSDLSSEPIVAALTITDLSGETIHSEIVEVRRGRTGHSVPLASLPFGWYRAELELTSVSRRLGRSHLDFAYLPAPPPAAPGVGESTLGVDLEEVPLSDLEVSADLIDRLGIGLVVVPAWDRFQSTAGSPEHAMRMRPGIDRLLDAGVDVVLSLPFVPADIARQLALDESEVLQMFQSDPEVLRPVLEDLLVQFGQRVQEWQLGTTRDPDGYWRRDLQSAVDAVWRELARLVPGPVVLIPWSIDQPLSSEISGDRPAQMSHNVVIPHELTPSRFDQGIDPKGPISIGMIYTAEQLPEDRFDRRQRAIDTAFRAIYARTARLDRVLLASPWTSGGTAENPVMPDPSLPGWMTASRMLEGRTFAGEVPFGQGLRALLFKGPDSSVLVAWNEQAASTTALLRAQLATQDVHATDMSGNKQLVPLVDGQHELLLTEEPTFIEGIDPYLAEFRQGFRIEASYVRAVPRDHPNALVIYNPWEVGVSGTLRVVSPEAWRFSPRGMTFSIPAHTETRLPLTLTFPRTEAAGDKRIEVDFELSNGEPLRFRAAAHLEIGLPYLEVEPTWRLVRSKTGSTEDIIVSAYITNTGPDPMSLELFLLAPNYRRMRRSISRLEPGETVLKAFHLPGGATTLGGETIRIGVGQIDNPERLIRTISFPSLRPALTTETSGTDPS